MAWTKGGYDCLPLTIPNSGWAIMPLCNQVIYIQKSKHQIMLKLISFDRKTKVLYVLSDLQNNHQHDLFIPVIDSDHSRLVQDPLLVMGQFLQTFQFQNSIFNSWSHLIWIHLSMKKKKHTQKTQKRTKNKTKQKQNKIT